MDVAWSTLFRRRVTKMRPSPLPWSFRMKSRIAIIAAIVSVCAGITPAQAQQANSLVGRWSIEYEVGRRIENGDVEAIRGKGQFTIAQSGDLLLVTLQGPARPDGTTPPRATMS